MSRISRISRNGQVVIPRSVRSELGLEEGDTLVMEAISTDCIVMRKFDPKKFIADVKNLRKISATLTDKEVLDEIATHRKARRA